MSKTPNAIAPSEIIAPESNKRDFFDPKELENAVSEIGAEILEGKKVKVKTYTKTSKTGKKFVVREFIREDPREPARRGFKYADEFDTLPPHINMAIPPAWVNVQINPNPNAKLYVIGTAANGKQQRIYNEVFAARKQKAKFSRIRELSQKFERIMSEVETDIRKGVNVEEASCLRLIMMTGIRPGGSSSAIGATTLAGHHVSESAEGDALYLRFTGKSHQRNSFRIDDAAVVDDIVARVWKNKSDYWGGRLFNTTNQKLLKYSKSKDGGSFKTKDFRTLIGTATAIVEIRKIKAPSDKKSYKKAVRTVAKKVSAKLNNTPAVALKSYINPSVFSRWRAKAGV